MNTPNTSARKHAKHMGMPSTRACEHISTEAHQAREHASIRAHQARDLADSCLAERFVVLEGFCTLRF